MKMVVWFVALLLFLNIIAFVVGLVDEAVHRCDNRKRRIHYIVPAYFIGCWLTEEVYD